MMPSIRRDELITVYATGDNAYKVTDGHDQVKIGAEEDFHIYFVNVRFSDEGHLRARYLGKTDGILLDRHCEDIHFVEGKGWLNASDQKVEKARMVSIHNKTGASVILKAD